MKQNYSVKNVFVLFIFVFTKYKCNNKNKFRIKNVFFL